MGQGTGFWHAGQNACLFVLRGGSAAWLAGPCRGNVLVFEIFHRKGTVIVEALGKGTAVFKQDFFLIAGLNPFGNAVYPVLAADGGNVLDHVQGDVVAGNVLDEAAVKLDGVKGDIGKEREVRIGGPEIVQGKVHAAAAVEGHGVGNGLAGNGARRFGDFYFDEFRGNVRILTEQGQDRGRGCGRKEREAGEVDGNGNEVLVVDSPFVEQPQHGAQHMKVQFPQQAHALHVVDEDGGRNDVAVFVTAAHQSLGGIGPACAHVDLGLQVDEEMVLGIMDKLLGERGIEGEVLVIVLGDMGDIADQEAAGLVDQILAGEEVVRPGVRVEKAAGIGLVQGKLDLEDQGIEGGIVRVGRKDNEFRVQDLVEVCAVEDAPRVWATKLKKSSSRSSAMLAEKAAKSMTRRTKTPRLRQVSGV